MYRYFLFIALLLITSTVSAQSGPYLFSGSGYMASGQIGLLTDDAESGFVLPALLVGRTYGGWAVGAATRTGISDLSEASAIAHIRLPWSDHVALGIQHTGIEGYSEQRITFGYARRLYEKLNVGIQFDLNRNAADEVDPVYAMSWSVSFHAPLLKELSMSAWVYNPLGDESLLDLPSVARMGILYTPSEKVGFALEAEKDWKHTLRLKAGLLYHLHPRLSVRWGVGSEPALVHAGIRWNLFNQLALGGGWRYHSRLGSSLSATLSQQPQP